MKERPILFSTMMVQALLAGRKTETRRVVKHPKRGIIKGNSHLGYMFTSDGNALLNGPDYPDGPDDEIKCPYGKVGDILWVRESFQRIIDLETGERDVRYAADNPEPLYLCDGDGFQEYYKDGREKFIPFKPSIHMPKETARIWLQVENISVERAQDISQDDAIAEGIMYHKEEGRLRFKDYSAHAKEHGHPDYDYPTVGIATTSFCTLWESINGRESWEANPWVWVVKFKVLSTTGKP